MGQTRKHIFNARCSPRYHSNLDFSPLSVLLPLNLILDLTTSDDTAGSRDLVTRLLQLPCGLVRGALANLGLVAVVRAAFLDERGGASILPAVSFTIKVRAPGS